MANFPARYAGGRWCQYFALEGADERMLAIPFKSASLQGDSSLRQHRYLSEVLAAGNAIADFSSYTLKELVQSDFTVVTAPTTGVTTVTMVNPITWTPAGGAVNTTFGKFGFFWRKNPGDADSAIRCAYWFDHTGSTNGTPYTVPAGVIGTATTG